MSKVFFLYTVDTYVQTSAGYMIADNHTNERVLFSTYLSAKTHLFKQVGVVDNLSNFYICDKNDPDRGVKICQIWSADKCVCKRFSIEPIELCQ